MNDKDSNRIRRILRRKLEVLDSNGGLNFLSTISPLLIINGDVYEMINPIVYSTLVSIKAILKEIENQKQKFKAMSTTLEIATPFYSHKSHSARQKVQE